MKRIARWGRLAALLAAGAIIGNHGAAQEARPAAALIKTLGSGDVNAMVAADDELRKLGPAAREAAPALAAQLDHPLGWVRSAASSALAAIGEGAVPELLAAYEKGPAGVRPRVLAVFAMMGAEARAALPALRAMLAKAPAEQREPIAAVIDQIEPPAAVSAASSEAAATGAVAAACTNLATGDEADWGQFHGPRRDQFCRETGLLKEWPAGGPKLLWTLKGLGRGFSSVAIAEGRLLTMGDRPDGAAASQFVIAYDLATREELWATRIGPTHLKEGPRCTPTIDGERVYALGTEGDLLCLETRSGKVLWHKSLARDFGGVVMSAAANWAWCESPLVDGPRLVCTPGGPQATIAALNKLTGEPIWKTALTSLGPKGKDGAGFSSPVLAELGGVRQYIQMLGRGLASVEAQSGRLLWSYNKIASGSANISHPLVLGDFVFTANGYNTGSALLKITRAGETFKAEEVYALGAKQFSNHHGGFVAVGGHVYGGIGDNAGTPVCLDLASGKAAWQAKAPQGGSASVLYADGNVLFRYDRGLVALVEASPKAFKVKSSFTPPLGEGPAWAHMVIHQGRLYLRHGDLLLCYDLKAENANKAN